MQKDQPRKSIILDLNKLLNNRVRVRLNGGRERILRGFDSIVHLVLDDTTETLRDPHDPYILTNKTRYLGLVVAKGTAVTMIYPSDGTEEIPNPFITSEY